jgi:hypothetical protein
MDRVTWWLCSDSMSRYFLIGRIILVITVGVAILQFTIMYVTSPPKHTLRRYPLGVRIRLIFFPSSGWQRVVHSEDIEALQLFRKGLFISHVLVLGWNTFMIFYF